jgi:hypothetical protein
MKADRYTKILLTIIAVFLGMLAFRPFLTPAHVRAQEPSGCACLQFDPSVTQIVVPNGAASVPGRVAIDLRNGSVYGFPADPLGYPRNPGKDQPAVSNPVLLGRFNLDRLSREPFHP